MLELMDLVILGIISCIVSAVMSLVAGLGLHYLRNRDVTRLYGRVESLEKANYGATGRAKREENNEEMEAALGEAAAIMANPEVKDKQAALIQLGLKHPTIALKLAKQFGVKL